MFVGLDLVLSHSTLFHGFLHFGLMNVRKSIYGFCSFRWCSRVKKEFFSLFNLLSTFVVWIRIILLWEFFIGRRVFKCRLLLWILLCISNHHVFFQCLHFTRFLSLFLLLLCLFCSLNLLYYLKVYFHPSYIFFSLKSVPCWF